MKTDKSFASRGLGALMALMAAGIVLAAASPAQAQLTEEEQKYLKEKVEGPSQMFILAPRIRAVAIPNFIWDLFLERHSSHWEDRANLSYGLEFVLRKPAYDVVFGLDWADLSQPSDWFLESGDPARKADFTTMPISLLSLNVGINWYFDISEVFGLYLGGGLGAGLVLGTIEKTDPSLDCVNFLENLDPDPTNDGDVKDGKRLDQQPCVDAQGNPQLAPGTTETEDRVPPVLPIINLAFGTQFTFAEHFVWRIETGMNLPYFYAGTSLGAMWW